MTNEEAIEILQEERDYAQFPQYVKKAIEIATAAIEKQIPKKPKVLKVHDISGYKYGECYCEEHIMDDEKYCSNCGQALDWSDI